MMLVLRFLILKLALSLLTGEGREATAYLDEQIRTLTQYGRISNVVENGKTKRTTPKEYKDQVHENKSGKLQLKTRVDSRNLSKAKAKNQNSLEPNQTFSNQNKTKQLEFLVVGFTPFCQILQESQLVF